MPYSYEAGHSMLSAMRPRPSIRMIASLTFPLLACALLGWAALNLAGCGGSGSSSARNYSEATFRVSSRAGLPVAQATVYLVPAGAVDTTPMTSQHVRDGSAESRDEPLEDAVRNSGASFPQGVTDADGLITITGIPDGRYYWFVLPGVGDTEHLPGGTGCRFARDHTVFAGLVTDLTLSSRPSPAANYLGSSVCLDCHTGHATAAQHAHRLGIAAPDALGALQDISRYADFELGWDLFLDAAMPQGGTAVYYSDYDAGRTTDKFKTSLTDPSPGETVYVRAWLWRDTGDGKFKISLENIKNPADPRNGPPLYTLEVPLSYGGAVQKQAYLCRVPGRMGLYPLLQFHTQGNDARYDRTRRAYRDFDLGLFWNDATEELQDPPLDATFEARCAACHFTDYTPYQHGGTGEWLATAQRDPKGAFDIDGDGKKDEINVGCEACHGPGTEHGTWAANPANAGHAARYIVSPEHLSPSRQLMLCARCHDRFTGNGPVGGEAPLDASGKMPLPGIGRHDFLATYVSQKGPQPGDLWSDDLHSRREHQQASDLLKSPKHRNDRILVTCGDCHASHGFATYEHQVTYDKTNATGLLCFRCHNLDHFPHMGVNTGSYHQGNNTWCTRCHMPNTAMAGAGTLGFLLQPPSGTPAEDDDIYYRNDRSSHLFMTMPRKTHPDVAGEKPVDAMPVPYTDACGQSCHDASPLPFLLRLPKLDFARELREGGR